MPLTRLLALLLTCLALMAGSATQMAAQPVNDVFTMQTSIFGEETVTGTTVGATREPDEPFHWWVGEGGSVWFGWQPFSSGCYTIDTCGSSFDTVLAVYQPTVGGPFLLDKITSNDDSPACAIGSRQSSVTVEVFQDGYYPIAIAGFGKNDAGNYTLRITKCPRPANDDYQNAQLLSLPAGESGTTVGATAQYDDPPYSWNPPNSEAVWFRPPPVGDDCLTITTESVGQRTLPYVYWYRDEVLPPNSSGKFWHVQLISEGSEYFGTGFNVVYRDWKTFRVKDGYEYRFACVGLIGARPFRIELDGCNPSTLPARRGDANGDGKVNIVDVTAIFNHLQQGLKTIPGNADANCDHTIDAADALFILHYLRDREEFFYYYGAYDCDGANYFASLLDPAKKYEYELLSRYEVAYLGTREWSRRIARDPVVVAESIPDYVPLGLYYFGGVQLTSRASIFAAWGAMVAFWVALGGLVAWQFRRDWSAGVHA